jgi:prepilin-type N-terminal cleavage/methylation domain-containing protein
MVHAQYERGAAPDCALLRRSERSRSVRLAPAAAAGFTLVELMVVVAIVGILATIAVVSYRKMVGESHSTEAIQVINAIRVAQEAYHSETGQYANISTSGNSGLPCVGPAGQGGTFTCTDLYPQTCTASPPTTLVGNFKSSWVPTVTNTGECALWMQLPVHSPGDVMYGYTTVAGFAGTAPGSGITLNGTAITWPCTGNACPADWFLISAVGDVDGDTRYSTYLGTSFSNEIIAQNEGE